MGIALLTLSSLFQGFSALQRTSPLARRESARPHPVRALRKTHPSQPAVALPRQAGAMSTPRPAALRVVRVCDAQHPSGEMGRLVISGRMADVCAELDRLVAREAAQQNRSTPH